MTTNIRFPFAVLALAASIGVANAQTAQEHEAHHPADQATPQTQAPTPTPSQRSMGAGQGGPGMMMGGDMGQMMTMMQQMMRGGMMPTGPDGRQPFRHLEGQLAFYKTELHITDAQLPQWNAFADVMRSNAKRLQEVMAPPVQSGMGASVPPVPDQLERRVAQLSALLEATQSTLGAVKPLYAVFTPEQKKLADELMAEHLMAMRMRGL